MEHFLWVLIVAVACGCGGTGAEAAAVGQGCDPLIFREGVRVTCKASLESRTIVNCYDRSTRVPFGTVAQYGCDAPFYVPVSTTTATSHGRDRITCNADGTWTGSLSRFYSFVCTLNCGVTGLPSVTQFVKGGSVTHASDWPWHATLFVQNRDPNKPVNGNEQTSLSDFEYICGGSLVKPVGGKEFVVVTAAHCVVDKQRGHGGPIDVNDLRIALGLEEPSLDNIPSHSPDAQVLRVKQIALHRSYDRRSASQADIAIIRLASPVALRSNIVPVCLSSVAGRPLVGDVGHVAGFGVYDPEVHSSASTVLRRATSPVVAPEKCAEWRSRKLNPQEFCAGSEGAENACFGDSGGGMVFNATNEHGLARFFLYGIVSHGRGVWNGQPSNCDTYSVYTRVGSYVNWIQELVQEFDETAFDTKTHPDGSTGCSRRLTGGECWRYCSGSEGTWCYTGSDCLEGTQEGCADKTACSGYTCSGAAEGCVRSCPAKSEHRPLPPIPRGSTGCSHRDVFVSPPENGNCWRYCDGSTATWCYTGLNCIGNEEACAEKTRCSGYSCDGAAADCVVVC